MIENNNFDDIFDIILPGFWGFGDPQNLYTRTQWHLRLLVLRSMFAASATPNKYPQHFRARKS